MDAVLAAPPARSPAHRGLLVFFALNYLAQGMAGVVYEPISYLLKDGLGLDAARSAAFVSWMTLPFLLKPLFGLVTDLLPIGGARRRPHMLAGAALGAGAWLVLALTPGAPPYPALLGLLVAANVSTVFCDVVCDGVMVESARKTGSSALFQSVQIGTLYATLVVTGLGGGWLAKHSAPRLAFAAAAALSVIIAVSSALITEDGPRRRPEGAAGLRALFGHAPFWAVSGLILLWNFSPFLGTAQFYHQSEALRLDPVFIGFLSTLAGGAGAAGAALFPAASRKLGSRRLLWLGGAAGAPLTLLYCLYLGPASVAALTVFFGVVGVIFRLALMDLAAGSAPEGSEATAFASYMAVFNLAAWGSNALGGWAYARLGGATAWPVLVMMGAATTLASLPLVYWTTRRAPR